MKKIITMCALLTGLAACDKTEVAYNGVVYSRHRVPLPDQRVQFLYSTGNKNEITGRFIATTNSKGEFSLRETLPKRKTMEAIEVHSDSGSYNSGLSGRRSIGDIEIVLQ